jgi:mRNA-degrading endonuclease YafQ of YafQ-DinJ toxin-antitoxin module
VIEIVWGPKFKRVYKKKLKQYPGIKRELSSALKLFIKDPFHPTLKTHKLGGPLKGNLAFSLGYDLRVVFKFLDKEEVFLETIGTHEEVY